MMSSELRKRFFDTAIGDVLRAVDGRSLVGCTALALCILDYLAYLRPVSKKNGVNYRKLVVDYLLPINSAYNARKIYALRCGLVHTYGEAKAISSAGLRGFQLNHKSPGFHLSGNPSVLQINVDTFVADVIWSAHEFFVATHGNPSVESRGDRLLVVGISSAAMAARPYASFHTGLSEFDKANPDIARLRSDVTALFP